MAVIEAKDLRVRYLHADAFQLEVPQLSIVEGQCVVVCGPSGSGKTTLLRLLNGLVPEYYEAQVEGELTLEGQSVWQQDVEHLALQVGTVFQNPATQFFHRRVVDELVFPCENQGLDRTGIEERLAWVTDILDLERLLERDLLYLSGGERQRVALATALMQAPRVLLLDEPTANLDPIGIQQVQDAIQRIKAAGITLIISEHRLHFLTTCADRYLYFDQGKLCADWSHDDFHALTRETRQKLGLRARQLAPAQEVIAAKQEAYQSLAKKRTGYQLEALKIGYAGKCLCSIPSLALPQGYVIGMMGDNGVGKTSLLFTLAGLLPPIAGQIQWQGQTLRPQQRLAQTAMVMQAPRLQFVTPSVRDEVSLGSHEAIDSVCQSLGLMSYLDQHPLSLSGGQQQRVMIAHAVLTGRQCYFFDEPTSGLDYGQMMEVSRTLQELATQDYLVLVVSHDDEFLATACDAIIRLTPTI